MNWGKILNKLILVFLVLNIILNFFIYNKDVKVYKMTDEREKNILHILEGKQITVKADMPKVSMPTSSIWLAPENIAPTNRELIVKLILGDGDISITSENNTRVYKKGSKELTFNNNTMIYNDGGSEIKIKDITEKKAKRYADKFLKQLNLGNPFKKAYVCNEKEEGTYCFTYYEKAGKLPIFSSYVRIKVSSSGVVHAVVHRVKTVKVNSAKKYIYPVDKVLFGIEEQVDTLEPVTITGITLGYGKEILENIDILEEESVPMYKIDIAGKKESIFINAYTNNVQ